MTVLMCKGKSFLCTLACRLKKSMSRVQHEAMHLPPIHQPGRARKASMEALHKLLTFPDWSLALQKEQQVSTQKRASVQIVTGNNLAAGEPVKCEGFLCSKKLLI